jgi:hypothetical protein
VIVVLSLAWPRLRHVPALPKGLQTACLREPGLFLFSAV